MIDVPAQIKNDYGKLIAKRGIPIHSNNFYQKYNYNTTNRGSLIYFIEKLNKGILGIQYLFVFIFWFSYAFFW